MPTLLPKTTVALAKYLQDRHTVNLDSMYRIAALGFKSRASCKSYLVSLGFVATAKRLLYTRSGAVPLPTTPVSLQPTNTTLVVTSYLLKTQVYKPFWQNLLSYVKHLDAQLVIIPHRYHNPTNLEQAIVQNDSSWIDPLVLPYLCWHRFKHGNVEIFADVRINPTSVNPLDSLKSCWQSDSIYAHTTQAMLCGSNSVYQQSPVAWCTGTLSKVEVADNLTAKKAEYHQRYGFLVTNGIDTRNVHASHDGSFMDLGMSISQGKIAPVKPTAAVWGDVHVGNEDTSAIQWATNLTATLDPELIVFHDLLDGSSINPHTISGVERSCSYSSIVDEIAANHVFISKLQSELATLNCAAKLAVASSNHHHFLARYFDNTLPILLDRAERQLLATWLQAGYAGLFPELVHLDYDALIEGVYVGRHGDKGINGAKGSIVADFNSGQRQVAGHSHTAGIRGGSERVGCLCKLVQAYNNNSLGNWVHSIAFIYPNGKIQHLIKRKDSAN